VIFAFPSSVSMMAPFTNMFCLARKVFDGVSMTVFIVDFFALFFVIMFAVLFRKETSFFEPPLVFRSLVFLFPIFTIRACFCFPIIFFFWDFLYRPPLVFLFVFIG